MQQLENYSTAPLPYGQVQLWWLGQMGFLIKSGDKLLCIDYFAAPRDDRQVPPPVPANEVTGVNFFLGTHNHDDHIDHLSWRIWKDTCADAKFVFPLLHAGSVKDDGIEVERCLPLSGEGEMVLCNKPGSYAEITEPNHIRERNPSDVRIYAIPAAHEFLDRDAFKQAYPALQYIIECGGLRIYHAGDTLRYEGMLNSLKQFGPIDVAILPINGRDAERYRRNCIGNMTFQEAVDLAGELQPRMVIPGHWDMFAGNSADPHAFKDYLEAKYGQLISCHIPEHARMISLRKAGG